MIRPQTIRLAAPTALAAVFCAALSALMAGSALAAPEASPEVSSERTKIDRIRVDKSERLLVLYKNGKRFKSYGISLGLNPKGHKRFEGDRRTPEGIYLIDRKNPNSAYHLSLHISYPNERDLQAADERGVKAGGQIMIHGMPTGLIKVSSEYEKDWTDGCIAVSNVAIEEIWRLVDVGTLIEITP